MSEISDHIERDVLWQPWDEPALEHLHLRVEGDVRADGLIVGVIDGTLLRARYEVRADSAYQFTELQLRLTFPEERTLRLTRANDGSWAGVSAEVNQAIWGCDEIDLSASPFTNTLPIKRLKLEPGQGAEIMVAFVEFPQLSVYPERQRYTLLERTERGSLYRFEHLSSGFTRDIAVDVDGLVAEYPDLFRRA
jgi:hypothetical protein